MPAVTQVHRQPVQVTPAAAQMHNQPAQVMPAGTQTQTNAHTPSRTQTAGHTHPCLLYTSPSPRD
eukprot:2596890-Alexandrium_andersonii.AAC.1